MIMIIQSQCLSALLVVWDENPVTKAGTSSWPRSLTCVDKDLSPVENVIAFVKSVLLYSFGIFLLCFLPVRPCGVNQLIWSIHLISVVGLWAVLGFKFSAMTSTQSSCSSPSKVFYNIQATVGIQIIPETFTKLKVLSFEYCFATASILYNAGIFFYT